MRQRRGLLLGIGIPVLVVALLVASWAIDTGTADGKVLRNVTLAGEDIGRLGEDQLAAAVRKVALQYAGTEVEIRTLTETYRGKADQLGLVLDEPATIDAALEVGREENPVMAPGGWLVSFASAREAPLKFNVRTDVLAAGLTQLQADDARPVTEPSVVSGPDGFTVSAGQAGSALDATAVAPDLEAAAETGSRPITVQAKPVETAPSISDESAAQLAAQLTATTATPLTVVAGPNTTQIPVPVLRSWFGSEPTPQGLQVVIDEPRVMADLERQLSERDRGPTDASLTVVNEQVVLTPSTDGFQCCAPSSPARILGAVQAGQAQVALDVIPLEPGFSTEAAQALGIKEKVGGITVWNNQPQVKQFTTYFQPGQPRVTNIHRIADLVRGSIIRPGETFSLNEAVGPRTVEKGFVADGVIYDGEFTEDIGGGVSQFAATLFNAAFFAGLDFDSYQAHSVYLERYPRGREATISYPEPDLAITNNTPYGVMIWTSHTPDSVTVTLYSTQNVVGDQTGQTESPEGPCTRVTTTRTRTYADGHKETDTVGAVYQPSEGVRCF